MRTTVAGGVIAGLLILAPAYAEAADGFKGVATVSRRVPADTLTIAFHLIERSMPEQQSRLRAEEIRIREEIRKAGATIVSWHSRASVMNTGFNAGTFNFISAQSREPQSVDMRRDVSVRFTGLTDAEPVAAVLGRNGIRNGVTFTWSSTQADRTREELAFDAVAAATEKAKQLAAKVGGKPGSVIDMVVLGPVTNAPRTGFVMTGVSQDIFTTSAASVRQSPPDELVEDDKGLGLIVSVTAAVTLQAKAD